MNYIQPYTRSASVCWLELHVPNIGTEYRTIEQCILIVNKSLHATVHGWLWCSVGYQGINLFLIGAVFSVEGAGSDDDSDAVGDITDCGDNWCLAHKLVTSSQICTIEEVMSLACLCVCIFD